MLAYFGEEDNDRIAYCLSNEDAITVHPADATWLCKYAGTRCCLVSRSYMYQKLKPGEVTEVKVSRAAEAAPVENHVPD